MWTATIAFPVTVLAFEPWWVALATAGVLIAITLLVSRKPKKVLV
jgi:UDP-GlcNAc:undecaprenyl-phosphate GlcNAc-1-phosphate transferase